MRPRKNAEYKRSVGLALPGFGIAFGANAPTKGVAFGANAPTKGIAFDANAPTKGIAFGANAPTKGSRLAQTLLLASLATAPQQTNIYTTFE